MNQRRSIPAAWWLFALLPGDVRVLMDVVDGVVRPATWALGFAPALVLLGVVAWAHASRSGLAVQVAKELRLLAPAALPALAVSGSLLGLQGEVAAVAPVAFLWCALFAGGLSFGAEASSRAMATWVMAPRSRAYLVGQKLAILALVLGVALADVLLGGIEGEDRQLAIAATVGALTVVPFFGIITRNTFAAVLIGIGLASCLGLGVTLVTLGLGGATVADGLVGFAAVVAVELALAAAALVGMFAVVRRLDPLRPATVTEATQSNVGPLATLLRIRNPLIRKELMLQGITLAFGAAMTVVWGAWALLRGAGGSNSTWTAVGVLGSLAFLAAILAGSMTFAEERTLETDLTQQMLLTRARIWRTKLGVAGTIVTLVCVVLPGVLLAIAPGWRAILLEVDVRSADVSTWVPSEVKLTAQVLMWASGVLATAAVGFLASSFQRDTGRAALSVLGLAASGAALMVATYLGVEYLHSFGVDLSRSEGFRSWAADLCGGVLTLSPEQATWLSDVKPTLVAAPLLLVAVAAVVVSRVTWERRRLLRPLLVATGVFVVATATVEELNWRAGRTLFCQPGPPSFTDPQNPTRPTGKSYP